MTDRLATVLRSEREVLATMLASDDACVDALDQLAEHHFTKAPHQRVFGAISDVYGRGETVDLPRIVAILQERFPTAKGVATGISDLTGKADASYAHLGYHVRVLREWQSIQALESTCRSVGHEAATMMPGGEKVEAALDRLGELALALEPVTSDAVSSLTEAISRGLAEIEAASQYETPPGIRSGIHDLDDVVGGFRKGELLLCAADTAQGKSIFALQVARVAASTSWDHLGGRPANVLYVTTEMRKEDLVKRMLSASIGLNMTKIRDGRLTDEDRQDVRAAAEGLRNLPLFIQATTLTVSRLVRLVRHMRRREEIDFLVVDLLQGIDGQMREREQSVARVSRALADLAVELDIPVLATAHVNRESRARQNKAPILTDLRESGALEKDADVVFFIHRDEKWGEHVVEFLVRKNRNGVTGGAKASLYKEFQRFQNPDQMTLGLGLTGS